ncbi:MAG TPA: hypothetical protein VIH59_34415 [Candidatus Tectomicrobia bacterium]|jgi:hypothetical protein
MVVLLLACLSTGCTYVSPKTTALQHVHETYRSEFAEFIVPQPGNNPTIPSLKADEPAFAETLREIRGYRMRYGENTPEAAHLKVLEGMIYLQSSRLGMAQLVQQDVQNAQSKLKSGTGHYTRDALLAHTFAHLLQGWQEIADFNDKNDKTLAEPGKLQMAADGIKNELDQLDRSKLAQPEVDEGAIYLATTAAIFYVWVYKLKSDAQEADGKKAIWFKKGAELIGGFLSETEKNAAAQAADAMNSPASRLRYLDWYGYLLREANAPQ